ncbi:MAG: hypothetical protein KBS86_03365 [Proteobacteria bacterium]|nr:hypothetical protein [Candidatus Enterousia scatequi]
MKKIALTSLLAMFAVSGANAANVINGNPLYKPGENHFASITSLDTSVFQNSDSIKNWGLSENFAYGVTDRLTVDMNVNVYEYDSFKNVLWGDFVGDGMNAAKLLNNNSVSFGADYRFLDVDGWVLDAGVKYGVNSLYGHFDKDVMEENYSFDKEETTYAWQYGLNGGYVGDCFTIAGHVYAGYLNTETFNWNDDGIHTINLGIDGQYIITDWLNLVAGVDYVGILDDKIGGEEIKNEGSWTGKIGANFNIDETKFIGVYATTGLHHGYKDGDYESSYKLNKSMGLGVKFGIDF